MENSGEQQEKQEISITVRWAGRAYSINIHPDDTVGELKRRICEVTNVLPMRQKLVGLKAGTAVVADDTLLGSFSLKPSSRVMMVGSLESDIFVDQTGPSEVESTFELPSDEPVAIHRRPENIAKCERRAIAYKINLLNPPRRGKNLLVLDVDYTLFDHRSSAEHAEELMRPFLHEFLTTCYLHYDIIIWSATGKQWVQLKMQQLGVLDNPAYKIVALMDHLAMITIYSEKKGLFDCKPLRVIWSQLSEFYGPENSVIVDDLTRNFAMNPKNGIPIKPYKGAHVNKYRDTELKLLARYLQLIASDVSEADHKNWRRYKPS